MLKEHAKIITGLHRGLDLAITALAFYLAFVVKQNYLPQAYRGLLPDPDYVALFCLIATIWYFSFGVQGVYAPDHAQSLRRVWWQCFKAISLGMLLLLMLLYVFKIEDISRILIGLFFLIDLALIFLGKWIIDRILCYRRAQGHNRRNVLIMGCDATTNEIIDALSDENQPNCKIIGCLIDRQFSPALQTDPKYVIGSFDDLEQILVNQVVDELVLTADIEQTPGILAHIRMADEMGVMVRILAPESIRRLALIPQIGTLKFELFLGIPALGIDSTPAHRGEMVFKTVLDYTVAVAGMTITFPIWCIAAAGIKLISPGGPVLYRQIRIGQNGREFTLYKFRTMIPNADRLIDQFAIQNECDGPAFKIKNDPRVLPYIGAILRKSSLDELPQLINVLKGELSIVGPRPPLPHEVKCYQHWQRRRLSMKPGITCFWQIQRNRNEVGFNDWIRMDLAYIDNWSLWLDFKIMLRTAWVMVTGNGR